MGYLRWRLLVLLVLAAGCNSCALLLRGFARAGVRGGGASIGLPVRGSLARGGALADVGAGVRPFGAPRASATRSLIATHLERAAGARGPVAITADGAIVRGTSRVGSWRADGSIYLRESTGGEMLAGRVHGGYVWGPDVGGNVIPVARIRGATTANGIRLRPGRAVGAELEVLRRDVRFDVIRMEEGWFEVRVQTGAVGWVPVGAVALLLVGAVPDDHREDIREVAARACIRWEGTTDHPTIEHAAALERERRTRAVYARARSAGAVKERLPGAEELLRGRRVELRFSEGRAAVAGDVGRLLESYGMVVQPRITDPAAGEVCGGELYYGYRELEAGRAVQGIVVDRAQVRITSHTAEGPMVLWLR
jgi:hypothetical protein